MKLSLIVGISLLLGSVPSQAHAQANAPTQGSPEAGPSDGGPPAPPALEDSSKEPRAQAGAAQPPSVQSPPSQQAPPGGQPSPPAQAQAQDHATQETPPGQWVYTQQYGWLWMPYGDGFTHVPADDQGQPYMYVYGPTLGWSWVVAPWVWGWGPYPYYGLYGPWRFAWYGWGPRWHGGSYGWYGGSYGWRGGYRAGPYSGYGSVRPAPPRQGYVGAPPRVSGSTGAHVGRPVGGPRGGRR